MSHLKKPKESRSGAFSPSARMAVPDSDTKQHAATTQELTASRIATPERYQGPKLNLQLVPQRCQKRKKERSSDRRTEERTTAVLC